MVNTMRAESEIKKGKHRIEDVLGLHTPQAVETVEAVVVDGNPEFDRIFAQLEEMYQCPIHDNEFYEQNVLTPTQITAFLQAVTLRYRHMAPYVIETGCFVNRLVQASYNAGHNGFVLMTTDPPQLAFLGDKLTGRGKDDMLRIRIECDAGMHCMTNMKYVSAHITGDVDDYFAGSSSVSNFFLEGACTPQCGNTQLCSYRTNNKVARHWLEDRLKERNRLVFIHEDGREELVRDYGSKK
jgi:hypothetical protein